jgi:hypothetical protein
VDLTLAERIARRPGDYPFTVRREAFTWAHFRAHNPRRSGEFRRRCRTVADKLWEYAGRFGTEDDPNLLDGSLF